MATPGDHFARPNGRTTVVGGSIAAVLLGGGLWLIAARGQGVADGDVVDATGSLFAAARAWVWSCWAFGLAWGVEGYKAHPAAMVAVFGSGVVPLMAAGVAVARWLAYRSKLKALQVGLAQGIGDLPQSCEAWLVRASGQGNAAVRLGELCRIGASEDCDIGAGEAGVAAFHALVRQVGDEAFEVLDVSGPGGKLAVNGRLGGRHRLRDGDVIEAGAVRVVFRLCPVGHSPRASVKGAAERGVVMAGVGAVAAVGEPVGWDGCKTNPLPPRASGGQVVARQTGFQEGERI